MLLTYSLLSSLDFLNVNGLALLGPHRRMVCMLDEESVSTFSSDLLSVWEYRASTSTAGNQQIASTSLILMMMSEQIKCLHQIYGHGGNSLGSFGLHLARRVRSMIQEFSSASDSQESEYDISRSLYEASDLCSQVCEVFSLPTRYLEQSTYEEVHNNAVEVSTVKLIEDSPTDEFAWFFDTESPPIHPEITNTEHMELEEKKSNHKRISFQQTLLMLCSSLEHCIKEEFGMEEAYTNSSHQPKEDMISSSDLSLPGRLVFETLSALLGPKSYDEIQSPKEHLQQPLNFQRVHVVKLKGPVEARSEVLPESLFLPLPTNTIQQQVFDRLDKGSFIKLDHRNKAIKSDGFLYNVVFRGVSHIEIIHGDLTFESRTNCFESVNQSELDWYRHLVNNYANTYGSVLVAVGGYVSPGLLEYGGNANSGCILFIPHCSSTLLEGLSHLCERAGQNKVGHNNVSRIKFGIGLVYHGWTLDEHRRIMERRTDLNSRVATENDVYLVVKLYESLAETSAMTASVESDIVSLVLCGSTDVTISEIERRFWHILSRVKCAIQPSSIQTTDKVLLLGGGMTEVLCILFLQEKIHSFHHHIETLLNYKQARHHHINAHEEGDDELDVIYDENEGKHYKLNELIVKVALFDAYQQSMEDFLHQLLHNHGCSIMEAHQCIEACKKKVGEVMMTTATKSMNEQITDYPLSRTVHSINRHHTMGAISLEADFLHILLSLLNISPPLHIQDIDAKESQPSGTSIQQQVLTAAQSYPVFDIRECKADVFHRSSVFVDSLMSTDSVF